MVIPIAWEFVEHAGRTRRRWSWRRVLADGSSSESRRFDGYAAAVSDAIRNGFQPDREAYSVTSAAGKTIHTPLSGSSRPAFNGTPSRVLRSTFRHFTLSLQQRRRLRKCLDAAIAAQRADKGNIQLVDDEGALEIVLQRGFKQDFLKTFEYVRMDDDSACGRAYRSASPVLIADVVRDQSFARYRAVAAAAGFRAVQSMPLTDAAGSVIGVLSVYYAEPLPFPEWRLARLIESGRALSAMLERSRALRAVTSDR